MVYEEPHYIDDKDEAFLHCLNDIRFKLRHMGLDADSNEAVRCEYISAILLACIRIAWTPDNKTISLNSQFSGGLVDYSITRIEELIAITESKQYQILTGFAQVCIPDFFLGWYG